MRHIDDWDAIQEAGEYENPVPGAYIAVIRGVEDVEEKEYLSIRWDFAEGAYKGANQETFDRAGFWPTVLIRSYKDTALRFFKSFKTSVEMSNKGYIFNDRAWWASISAWSWARRSTGRTTETPAQGSTWPRSAPARPSRTGTSRSQN